MSKLATPKQRVAQILGVLKAHHTRLSKKRRKDDRPDSAPSKTTEKTVRLLKKPLRALFKRAGLDINNDDHWHELLIFIAWAIYSKDPGHPKSWTNKKLRQLRANVTTLQSDNANLTEYDCCEQLAMKPQYVGLTPRTLRRRLQDAKALVPSAAPKPARTIAIK